MGRLTALVIGVPLCLAVIAWGALTVVALVSLDSFQIQRSFSPSGHQLSLSLDNGDLTLVPGRGSQVDLTGVAHYSLVRPTVSVDTTGGGVTVTVTCPWFADINCSADLTVAVPAGVEVTASTDTGDVTASHLDDLSLQSDTGDLQVNGGKGVVHLSTDTGQITGTALDATDVTANADTGDITLDFAQPPTNVSAQDDTGDVTVSLPAGAPAYAVSARSQTGSTAIDVPTDPDSADDISISTDTGNVVVDPAG
jgi:DUF4097 and DUF4098 domain-containing protein YvlB